MSDIRRHYEEVLGPVYTWMMGGAEARLAANRELFRAHGIGPGALRGALDLGAGSGFQSIPLAELGFSVTAVDVSPTLLAELRERAGPLPIRTLARDLLPVTELVDEPQALVVCAGDTLTHLSGPEAVEATIAGASRVLGQGGRLVLTFRDLTKLPSGNDRFLPVRSTPERIFTCFLEEVDAQRVRVTDLVHERQGDGFVQRVGSYFKLRIAPDWLDELLRRQGFVIDVATVERGLVTRIASLR